MLGGKAIPILVLLLTVVVTPVAGKEPINVVDSLIQSLDDEDSRIRAGATEALGIINDTRAVEPLIRALKDEDYWVRLNAREALGEIGKRQREAGI